MSAPGAWGESCSPQRVVGQSPRSSALCFLLWLLGEGSAWAEGGGGQAALGLPFLVLTLEAWSLCAPCTCTPALLPLVASLAAHCPASQLPKPLRRGGVG